VTSCKEQQVLDLSFSLQYSLRQEPYIDLRGQRPVPATI